MWENISFFGLSLAVIAAILFFIVMFGWPFKVGNKNKTPFLAITAIVFFLTGGLALMQSFTGGLPGSVTPDGTTTTSGCVQPSGGNTATTSVAVRNPLSPSLVYLGAGAVGTYEAAFIDADGNILANGGPNGGTTLSYRDLSVTPCKTGSLVTLSTAAYNGVKVTADTLVPKREYVLLASNSTDLETEIFTTTFGNGDDAGTVGTGTQSSVITLGQNEPFDRIVQVHANRTGGSAQLGSSDGSWYISADIVSTATWAPSSDIAITSRTGGFTFEKVTCPSALVIKNSADVCWKVNKPLANSAGTLEYGFSAKASLANPAVADGNLTIYYDDENWFRDTDGKVKFGVADSAGTDIGESRSSTIFSIA